MSGNGVGFHSEVFGGSPEQASSQSEDEDVNFIAMHMSGRQEWQDGRFSSVIVIFLFMSDTPVGTQIQFSRSLSPRIMHEAGRRISLRAACLSECPHTCQRDRGKPHGTFRHPPAGPPPPTLLLRRWQKLRADGGRSLAAVSFDVPLCRFFWLHQLPSGGRGAIA